MCVAKASYEQGRLISLQGDAFWLQIQVEWNLIYISLL